MAHTLERQEALRDQIKSVRESILDIVTRMEDIRLQQIPQISADYAVKIGCWEQQLLQAELDARRAKRQLSLAQAQANRGIAPQMGSIDAQLDGEFSEWMDKANKARRIYERQLAYLMAMTPLSRADAKRFKHLHRILVKRLHPDMHADQDDEREALFLLMQAAYRNGDIQALRSIEVATRHFEAKEDDLDATDDEEALAQELELARIEEGVMRERLQQLEQCEDMQLAQLLANPEWVTARTTELRQAIEEWERLRVSCDKRLKALREAFDE